MPCLLFFFLSVFLPSQNSDMYKGKEVAGEEDGWQVSLTSPLWSLRLLCILHRAIWWIPYLSSYIFWLMISLKAKMQKDHTNRQFEQIQLFERNIFYFQTFWLVLRSAVSLDGKIATFTSRQSIRFKMFLFHSTHRLICCPHQFFQGIK